jgi:hypothetical protein
MKRAGIIGLFVAVIALLAGTATSAFAFENLPHYGKCTAKSGGKYDSATCTKIKAGKETYEWEPIKEPIGFKSKKAKSTGEAVLEGKSGIKISCTEQVEKEGEYGPANEVKNVVGEFSGCQTSNVPCSSEGKPSGTIFTFKLHGEPGIVEKVAKEEKNVDGNDLRGQSSPELAKFTCSTIGVTVTGGVVVKAESKGKLITNKMIDKTNVEFIAEPGGVQVPREWTPNGEGTSNSTHARIVEHLESNTGSGPEESGQTLITTQETLGKVKVELRQCEKTISCPN